MESQERWPRIKEIVGEALERAASERGAFLDQACSNDGELRAEIESLLLRTRMQTPYPDSRGRRRSLKLQNKLEA